MQLKLTLALLLAFAATIATAVAQQPTQEQQNAIRQSCRSDYQANCASVPPGGSASLQCLQSNLSKLSPACQSAVSAVAQPTAPAQPSTATSQPAPTPAPGAPATTQAAPAAPSTPAMAPPPPMSPRQAAMRMRMACGTDFRAYCPGVPFGGGRAMDCLAANEALLSQPCRGMMSEMRAR